MVQYPSDLLGMQRNNMETRRKIAHICTHGRKNVQSCALVDLQGVLARMKVNRTYSIDVSLVQQLRSKRNQSDTVCRALRLYLAGEDEYSVGQVPTRNLLAALSSRSDLSEQLKAVIIAELNNGSE